MSKASQVLVLKESGVMKVILNRPEKKNAFNGFIFRILSEYLKIADNDESIKIFYLTGIGNYFTGGIDFNWFNEDTSEDIVKDIKNLIDDIINFRKISVIGVQGICYGIGFTIMGLFDFAFCSENAKFIAPFSNLQISPGGCSTYTFPKIFGKSMANHLLINSGSVKPEELLRAGLVLKIFNQSEFESEVNQYISNLLKHPIDLMIKYKEMITRNFKEDLLKTNKIESKKLYESFFNEGFIKQKEKFLKPKIKSNAKPKF